MNIQAMSASPAMPLYSSQVGTPGTSSAHAATSSSSNPTLSSNSAEQTFIQLLVTELQSQDPTSPMDPTTMVSQMFSMNQLQQLIDINQTLSGDLNGSSSSSSSRVSSPAISNLNTTFAQATAASPSSAAASYAQQLLTGAH
ncbi:MAG: flagellar hook capping FlgD N-terminal domain-containing protein [Terriglobales bacterium]